MVGGEISYLQIIPEFVVATSFPWIIIRHLECSRKHFNRPLISFNIYKRL